MLISDKAIGNDSLESLHEYLLEGNIPAESSASHKLFQGVPKSYVETKTNTNTTN